MQALHNASEVMAHIRKELLKPPSWDVWIQLTDWLLKWPEPSSQEVVLEYVRQHLDALWPDALRLGLGQWPESHPLWSLVKGPSEEVMHSLNMAFCWRPPGTFWQGSNRVYSSAGYRWSNLGSVEFKQGLWLQRSVVTYWQYADVMGFEVDERQWSRPVQGVSVYEALDFCNRLSERHGLEPAYQWLEVLGEVGEPDFSALVEWKGPENTGFRLPMETEWEVSIRAGWTLGSPQPGLQVGEENHWRLRFGSGTLEQWVWPARSSGWYRKRVQLRSHPEWPVCGGVRSEEQRAASCSLRILRVPSTRQNHCGFRICRTSKETPLAS
jgi:formylglycine-generating enzyme required for sulfatase activity